MRKSSGEWTVRMLADMRGRINTDAEYQRGVVWSQPQQQLLIDSILRGFDIPKIFLRKREDGERNLFDVIDGVQRLTAIWRYLADDFPLPKKYSYPDLVDVAGRRWSELNQDAQDRIQFAKITVTELETYSETDIRELFQRLQKGEPLNAAERRNAMSGPVRDFVANILAKHRFWSNTGLRDRRFAWHEMSAIILALVKAGGPTGLKGADLHALYEDDAFDSRNDVAIRAIQLLDRLDTIASHSPGMIRTRWGFADLVLTLIHLEDEQIEVSADEIIDFFDRFEQERRAGAAELSDLRSTVIGLAADEDVTEADFELPTISADMLAYLNAFTREGATTTNVATRARIMTNRLKQHLSMEP